MSDDRPDRQKRRRVQPKLVIFRAGDDGHFVDGLPRIWALKVALQADDPRTA
jgi:hypothetical protein